MEETAGDRLRRQRPTVPEPARWRRLVATERALDAQEALSSVRGRVESEDLTLREITDALTLLRTMRAMCDSTERELIEAARAGGVTWAQLAGPLGVRTRQAAEQRYARLAATSAGATVRRPPAASRGGDAPNRNPSAASAPATAAPAPAAPTRGPSGSTGASQRAESPGSGSGSAGARRNRWYLVETAPDETGPVVVLSRHSTEKAAARAAVRTRARSSHAGTTGRRWEVRRPEEISERLEWDPSKGRGVVRHGPPE